jgi:hypothetical protein
MKKPELMVESIPKDDFLQGRCSLCPHTIFNLKGDTIEQKTLLRQLFDVHVKRVHTSEDQ